MNKNWALIIVISLLLLLSACTFTGDVYVRVVWQPSEGAPDLAFSHDITDVPGSPNNAIAINQSAYYKTDPGTYTISYQYTGYALYTLPVMNIAANETVLGSESAYYDIVIYRDNPPLFVKVPLGP